MPYCWLVSKHIYYLASVGASLKGKKRTSQFGLLALSTVQCLCQVGDVQHRGV